MEGRYERPYIWLEEAPVWWIVSEEKQILLARDCLVAGIEYDQIDSYLRKHLLKELLALDPQEELENERKIARAEEQELLRDAAKNARRIHEIRNQLGESTDVIELPEDKGIQIVFKKNQQ